MKVLHIGKFFPPHRGGIETHIFDLCRGLARSADVDVIVANDAPGYVEEQCETIRVRRLAPVAKIASVPICPQMARAIRETPADLVHLHLPNPYAGATFLASNHKAPLVVSWHSDVVRQRLLNRLLRPVERALIRRASAFIASSPNYVESSPILNGNRSRCHVIPYGIDDLEMGKPDTTRIAALRRTYGSRIVLAVGRLVYYKGFDHLIRAMGTVKGHLLIVGEGPLRLKLMREAIDAGVNNRVTFLGNVSRAELINCYHAADVFALPAVARSEAFGIVQLEAMACGKPVVNTRLSCGVPYVSVDNETGITVEPESSEPLADAINRLLDDGALRMLYGAAARKRVRKHFNLDLMVDRTLDLYRQILNRNAVELMAEQSHSSDTDQQPAFVQA
ncbi:MAG TPA: glycosyltransferase [Candidatus Binataceae bacterium]|nr:glycosyltransferase [Candidatus Binataceae bacterium]